MQYLKLTQRIVLPPVPRQTLLTHCARKLAGRYTGHEPREPKAYGVIAGVVENTSLIVHRVFPLYRNQRYSKRYKAFADAALESHGVPSETPFAKRGWVADPDELQQIYKRCNAEDLLLFGNYHMHRVAWDHDPLRDSCTELDTELAKGSGIWTFIVSMVNPGRPGIRAFFEGDNACEAPILTR